MGFFNWPFSNLHELNLDWIIEKLQNLLHMNVTTDPGESGSYNEETNTLNIPVQEEVSIGNTAPTDGEDIWVDPDGVPYMDNVVQSVDGIGPVNGNVTLPLPFSAKLNEILDPFDLNSAMTSGFYRYDYASGAHTPSQGGGDLIVMERNTTYVVQLAFPSYASETDPYRGFMRMHNANGWTPWRHIGESFNYSCVQSYGTTKNFTMPGIYVYTSSAADAPSAAGGFLIHMQTQGNTAWAYQMAFQNATNGVPKVFVRMKYTAGGVTNWTNWYTVGLS